MEKTGKKKKGNTKANNNKFCCNSKCPTKQQKLQVVKHFDTPCRKCKRSSVQDEFPEVAVREAEGSFEKPKKPKLRKRSSQSNSSDGSVRRFAKQSSNGKNYLNKLEVEKPPPPVKDVKGSLLSSTSSTSSMKNVPSETKKIANQKTAAPNDDRYQSCCAELVRAFEQAEQPNPENIRMSMKDMRNRLQERLTKDGKSPTPCGNRVSETYGSPTRRMPPCRDNRESCVQQLRREIICSKPLYSCEIKKTVTELKSEIAKYRETLSRNVNILQERLGPNFFQKAGTPRQSTGVSPLSSAAASHQGSARGIPAKKSLSSHSHVLVQTDVSGAVGVIPFCQSVDKTSNDSAKVLCRSANVSRTSSATKQPVAKGYCCPPTCLVQPADTPVKYRISSMPSLATEVIPEVTEEETVTDTDVEPSKVEEDTEDDKTVEASSETEIATEGLSTESPVLSPKISVSER